MTKETQPRRLTTKPYVPDKQGRLYNRAYFEQTGIRSYPIDTDRGVPIYLDSGELARREYSRHWRQTDFSPNGTVAEEDRDITRRRRRTR